MSSKVYDVIIIGGGVSGTALLYELAQFTNLSTIALVEKYASFATVNSKSSNNSQTIHCGDIETNYSIDKAIKVKHKAGMLVNYATRKLSEEEKDRVIFKYSKMALGVGKKECDFLRERYKKFHPHFPRMELIGKEDIAKTEPNVALVNGKYRKDEIVAISIKDEYTAIDYKALSESFVARAREAENKDIDFYMSTTVDDIKKDGDMFFVMTTKGRLKARFVVVSAGGHSLLLAQQMGYGLNFSCLPMAGSFYFAPQVLNGKVYTVQNDKLPFAAVHGDPDVCVPGKTRFGPTALVLPMLERYNKKTILQFFRVLRFDRAVFATLWGLLRVKDIRNYIFKNILFEIPGLREWLFLKDIRKIVPSLQKKDIHFAKGFGGIRPQLIDKKERKLLLGEARINPGDGIIFNMTPSPGATTCLGNAEKDMQEIAKQTGCLIDEEKFKKALL